MCTMNDAKWEPNILHDVLNEQDQNISATLRVGN